MNVPVELSLSVRNVGDSRQLELYVPTRHSLHVYPKFLEHVDQISTVTKPRAGESCSPVKGHPAFISSLYRESYNTLSTLFDVLLDETDAVPRKCLAVRDAYAAPRPPKRGGGVFGTRQRDSVAMQPLLLQV